MRIAFLFSGQVRNIPIELFRISLSNLTKNLDYDIFSYSWLETGKSLNHSRFEPKIDSSNSAPFLIENLFQGFNLRVARYELFAEFEENLLPSYRQLYKSKRFHFGTINTMAQIYTISNCFNLIAHDLDKYDLIFKCRYDSIYVHPLNIYNLESIESSNKLYNLNFGRAFYPNRVYDIFFGGSTKAMFFLNDIWEKLPELVEDKFNNNLDRMDPCRIFYLAAYKNKIEIDSFNSRICDIFRNFKNNYYEKYLLSMHLIRIKDFPKNAYILNYFYRWFIFRKFNFLKIFYFSLLSILIVPFAYLKRFKYFLFKLKKVLF